MVKGKYSDVDICLITDNEKIKEAVKHRVKDFYPDLKFEPHFYSENAFREKRDFVILDSLLNGIPWVVDIPPRIEKYLVKQ